MRPLQIVLTALTVLAWFGIASCGNERAANAPDSPASSSAAPATEGQLIGVWSQVGLVEEGVLETPGEDEYVILVLRENGTATIMHGSGEQPDLAALCGRKPNLEWTLSKAGTALELDEGLVWTIVTLDETSFTFEEGSSEFVHDRLGGCG